MMARLPETVQVVPSPRRLVDALRDVGYNFVGAVADLVDNSIAANATAVDIDIHWNGTESWLRIADNGTGMDSRTITEALRFGSERSYRADDLGKFGLGLKTASLSQCRTIYVASRMSEQRARIEVRRFDLDRIIETDEWVVEILTADRPEELTTPLGNQPGTVVIWRNLDRLFGSRTPTGDRAQKALWTNTERLEEHLGMVFHRFIEGDLTGRQRRPLRITINGNPVRPWDPFATSQEHTERLRTRDFDISAQGVSGVVTFEPYILPTQAQFSSDAEFKRQSGPNSWNQQQGFYIYRANRMIQAGGWSRMRAPDEHTKYARVALDFFPELDAAFGINIAKMRVNFPAQLRERLKDPVEELIRRAKRAYSAKPTRQPGPGKPVSSRAPVTPAPKPPARPSPAPRLGSPEISVPVQSSLAPAIEWPPPPLMRRSVRDDLLGAAEATGDVEALARIMEHLKRTKPEVADELGW
ncbi:MAG: ATP-binding protein [Actinomycetales bacterium]